MSVALAALNEATQLRITTGNPQADKVLHGGFPAHSINVIMGQPGTGKTIFAEQMLFHNASAERPVLYLTTLSEPFQKVVSYLQRFSFYDEASFGTSVVYDDVGQDLVQHGIEALRVRLRTALQDLQPRIIVIDSFKAVHDLIGSTLDARRWIVDLAGALTAMDTTSFLVGEYTTEHIAEYPEFAVADSIIEFARKPLSNRDERYMRVLKLRGSDYAEGLHGVRITNSGLEVYPRLVGTDLKGTEAVGDRITSGIPELDDMLGGGLWRGSSTLLVGTAGAGKTTLALQFILEGIRRGEPGIFFNMQETPIQLSRVLHGLGHNAQELKSHGIHMLYVSPVELHIDSVVTQLFEIVRREGIQRLAIDAVGDLITAASNMERLHDYLYALMQHLSAAGVTTMLTLESVGDSEGITASSGARLSYMSDNIFHLTLDLGSREPGRSFQIVKARATNHDLRARRFTIGAQGIRLET